MIQYGYVIISVAFLLWLLGCRFTCLFEVQLGFSYLCGVCDFIYVVSN